MRNMTAVAGCGDKTTIDYVNGENVTNPVAWVNVGFHHVPRDEDQSPMPIHWQGFSLYPRDWHANNSQTPPQRAAWNGRNQPAVPTPTPSSTPTADGHGDRDGDGNADGHRDRHGHRATPTPTATPPGFAPEDVADAEEEAPVETRSAAVAAPRSSSSSTTATTSKAASRTTLKVAGQSDGEGDRRRPRRERQGGDPRGQQGDPDRDPEAGRGHGDAAQGQVQGLGPVSSGRRPCR